jgi:CheY-like chemotaxis protein
MGALALAEHESGPSRPRLRAVGPATTASAPHDGKEAAHARRTVLIAEDDEALRTTLGAILETEGYDVIQVPGGESALETMREQQVDVLVLDLHMPGLDGLGVLAEIPGSSPLVIVNSAFEYYSPSEVRDRFGARVFRTLRKPVPPVQLIKAVSEAVAELDGPPA